MNARSEQSPARTRRGRGRPASEDASGLREDILDEAEARFARKGYAATSVREIADAVDVNPAMVHYYFGSKHDLLRQVMERDHHALFTPRFWQQMQENIEAGKVLDIFPYPKERRFSSQVAGSAP